MLQEALEFSCGFVAKHPEFVPPGMTRDCAVAVVLYTFGEYCINILLIVLSFFLSFFVLFLNKQTKITTWTNNRTFTRE